MDRRDEVISRFSQLLWERVRISLRV